MLVDSGHSSIFNSPLRHYPIKLHTYAYIKANKTNNKERERERERERELYYKQSNKPTNVHLLLCVITNVVWEYFFNSCDDDQEKEDTITQIMVVPATKLSEEKHFVESSKEEGTIIMALL